MHCCKRAVNGRSSTAHRLDEAFDADTIRRSPSGVDGLTITQRTFSQRETPLAGNVQAAPPRASRKGPETSSGGGRILPPPLLVFACCSIGLISEKIR
jgi:hypothetical protein